MTLSQIAEGLYEVSEVLTGSPEDLQIIQYLMPDMFGNHEQEEMAARVLLHSQVMGKWVGVSIPRLLLEMRGDLKRFADGDENIPSTCIVFTQVSRMFHELHKLIMSGYFTCVMVGEGDDAFSVIYPNQAVVSKVLGN